MLIILYIYSGELWKRTPPSGILLTALSKERLSLASLYIAFLKATTYGTYGMKISPFMIDFNTLSFLSLKNYLISANGIQ